MSFPANVLKVMIASPGDVPEERKIVTEEIHRWNDANASSRNLVLLPVKWETHSTPQLGSPPQTIINRQLLEEADIVIGIFGTRIGTPTEEYVSGTVEEIKRHVAAGKTAKVYFSEVPVAPSLVNAAQYASVQQFREECRSSGLYATFDNLQQFRIDVSHHLDIELNQPRYRWLTAPETTSAEEPVSLGGDALNLLDTAAKNDGEIIASGDVGVSAAGRRFDDRTPRSVARWRAAVQELIEGGAVEHVSGLIYRVTAAGYRINDGKEDNTPSPAQTLSPFDEAKRAHTKTLVDVLSYMQRDLPRFLLLQSGFARLDVISRAATNKGAPIDVNGLCAPVVTSGLIARVDDQLSGYGTMSVNETLAEILKMLLFPRKEGNSTPFFEGIPVL